MSVVGSFLIAFVLGSIIRFPAVWLVGSAFLMEEDKVKAGIVALIGATLSFILGFVPVLGTFSVLVVGIINFSLFKSLYDAGTGGAIGAAFLVETVTSGILFGVGILLAGLGI